MNNLLHPAITLDNFLTFLSRDANREKANKLIQYTCRFLSWFAPPASQPRIKLDLIYKNLSDARRFHRFFREFSFLYRLKTLPRSSLFNVLELLSLVSQGAMAVYFVTDHLMWFASKEILILGKGDVQKLRNLSNHSRFYGLLFALIHCIFLLFYNYLKRTETDKRNNSSYEILRQEGNKLFINCIRLTCDLIIGAESLEYIFANDGILGICGIISASEGFYSGWPNKTK